MADTHVHCITHGDILCLLLTQPVGTLGTVASSLYSDCGTVCLARGHLCSTTQSTSPLPLLCPIWELNRRPFSSMPNPYKLSHYIFNGLHIQAVATGHRSWSVVSKVFLFAGDLLRVSGSDGANIWTLSSSSMFHLHHPFVERWKVLGFSSLSGCTLDREPVTQQQQINWRDFFLVKEYLFI